ncbi:hypothetical protein Ciccas_009393 [Cichlidogyrus casuarinus]|uniref:Galactose mutarotase n=1 Tax=Cichlidogyrus casuarinus TaxID=1844966 RepID=A0ABD2Q1M2_9PLAT
MSQKTLEILTVCMAASLYHVNWDVTHIDKNSLTLIYTSPDQEDGFPGSMLTEVTYKLQQLEDLPVYSLKLIYKATMREAPCPINLTNHSYFNLAGHNKGRAAICNHKVQICSTKSLELDKQTLLPTGRVQQNTGEKDLSTEKQLGKGIENGGYDQFYIFDEKLDLKHELAHKIKGCQFSALDTVSNRKMVGLTDQVGVQFYTAACLHPSQPNGKHKQPYESLGAFCFETQAHPDGVNLGKDTEKLPNMVYYPNGEPYTHRTAFYFFDSSIKF